jgi:3-phenylpropionate/trans-cinnamate dioxygenase ferredoxin reductase subunit
MRSEATNVVVVGGGVAALRTAERLRARGFLGAVTILTDEPYLPYDRPPLSKQVLRGEVDTTTLRSADELASLNIEVRTETVATTLDLQTRAVVTPAGKFHFDVVVIATGARARRAPDINGHVLRSADDARNLRDAIREARRLTVVGAGLVGCEVAASARTLGVDVDLVDTLPGPMTRVVGPVVTRQITDLHARHGVRLHLSTPVIRNASGQLVTEAGVGFGSGPVVEAVGVRPNIDWLLDTGLPLDDGVVTDAEGHVTDDVYAVGDVACWNGVRREHWTSAITQADKVAAAIVGAVAPRHELPYWWSDQYDVRIQGLGAPAVDDDVDLLAWGPKRRPVALYSRSGSLTGVVGFSAAAAVMRLRDDIVTGTRIDAVVRSLDATGH